MKPKRVHSWSVSALGDGMARLNTKTELITALDDSIHHPTLGKVTVREMLYFTIYHNLRQASQEGD